MSSNARDRVLANLEAAWQLPAVLPPHEAGRQRGVGGWLHAITGRFHRRRT